MRFGHLIAGAGQPALQAVVHTGAPEHPCLLHPTPLHPPHPALVPGFTAQAHSQSQSWTSNHPIQTQPVCHLCATLTATPHWSAVPSIVCAARDPSNRTPNPKLTPKPQVHRPHIPRPQTQGLSARRKVLSRPVPVQEHPECVWAHLRRCIEVVVEVVGDGRVHKPRPAL